MFNEIFALAVRTLLLAISYYYSYYILYSYIIYNKMITLAFII